MALTSRWNRRWCHFFDPTVACSQRVLQYPPTERTESIRQTAAKSCRPHMTTATMMEASRARSSSAHLYSVSGQRTAESHKGKMNTVSSFPCDASGAASDLDSQGAGDIQSAPTPRSMHTPAMSVSSLVETNSARNTDDTMVWSTCTPTEVRPGTGDATIVESTEQNVLSRISTLAILRDQGFIDDDEFQRRKKAIIDELTFPAPAVKSAFKLTNGIPLIIPHAPNFEGLEAEEAIRHTFNYETRRWETSKVCVMLDETPFAKGSLRLVYHMRDVIQPLQETYVAKLAIDPDEDPQTYFRDIELQAHCAHYARLYNEYTPPKNVEFIQAWVLELTQRNGALCAVERYIAGEYRKHNNNFGSVSDEERNTPQAFSHFTYEASHHELLAVDIQGVGDRYTDPQIHTLNGHDFGKGNLGVLGFKKFLASHRCNSICTYLKLPPVNPKVNKDYGTVPVQRLMNLERVEGAPFESKHYYENAPMLKKYIAQCRDDESQTQKAIVHERSCALCGVCVIQ
ncbi:Aste57867_21093 [Aphanomyces stellatus]|uniref:Aste57867_21093 protein n=1 Tax=Aphanomyces stellatus TaxID=120398 RepID=A0A485LHW0_9STRA|nr:hypothetical protein As57867_021025 [Aphanomyces stellatus]VFT97767.1 Aste57867_21093 [Aphanomyces stellatus]